MSTFMSLDVMVRLTVCVCLETIFRAVAGAVAGTGAFEAKFCSMSTAVSAAAVASSS